MVRVREIVQDRWIVFVERTVGGATMIALLGDGDGDDAHGSVGKPGDHGGGIVGRDHDAGQRAHHAKLFAGAVALGAQIEPILRRERIAHGRAAQADAANAPRRIVSEQRVSVRSKMRTREGAKAKMANARRQIGGRVAGARNGVGQRSKRLV